MLWHDSSHYSLASVLLSGPVAMRYPLQPETLLWLTLSLHHGLEVITRTRSVGPPYAVLNVASAMREVIQGELIRCAKRVRTRFATTGGASCPNNVQEPAEGGVQPL